MCFWGPKCSALIHYITRNKNFKLWRSLKRIASKRSISATIYFASFVKLWFFQISIKFTNEPPQGIRSSLKRTYVDVSQVRNFFLSLIGSTPKVFSLKWKLWSKFHHIPPLFPKMYSKHTRHCFLLSFLGLAGLHKCSSMVQIAVCNGVYAYGRSRKTEIRCFGLEFAIWIQPSGFSSLCSVYTKSFRWYWSKTGIFFFFLLVFILNFTHFLKINWKGCKSLISLVLLWGRSDTIFSHSIIRIVFSRVDGCRVTKSLERGMGKGNDCMWVVNENCGQFLIWRTMCERAVRIPSPSLTRNLKGHFFPRDEYWEELSTRVGRTGSQKNKNWC